MNNKKLSTKEEFTDFVNDFKTTHEMPFAFAIGIGYCDENGNIATARFPAINIDSMHGTMSVIMHSMQVDEIKDITVLDLTEHAGDILRNYFKPYLEEEGHANIDVIKQTQGQFFSKSFSLQRKALIAMIYPTKESLTETSPINNIDVMCRLAMISSLFFKPNEINLNNAFGLLKKLYYIPEGALTTKQWISQLMIGNYMHPISVDKFPPLCWGAPLDETVRVGDPTRVRLGAYLAPGTTVMHEGFVNFNAGTLGPGMIEGRISQGVIIGKDCDLGGGCSIMGTLSGGGKLKITIGDNCLLGANSGIGISLGNRCTVEAGLYVTTGTKIKICSKKFDDVKNSYFHDDGLIKGKFIKALYLSGLDDMLFIRHSISGGVELHFNDNPNKLDKVLHA